MQTKSWHSDAVKLHLEESKTVREISEKVGIAKSTVGDYLKWYKDTFGGDGKSARVLIFDIETAPMLSYHWGRWKQNIRQLQTLHESFVLSWAAKWLDDDKTMYGDCRETVTDHDDFDCVESLWRLIDEADVVVAHNGDRFDLKRLNSRWLLNGLPEPNAYRSVDTLKILKRKFGFASNRLGDIGETLELGGKVSHSGFALWIRCLAGEAAAFEEMKEYNIRDVDLLEEAYKILRGWDHLHPNMSIYREDGTFRCPVCDSTDTTPTGRTRTTQRGAYRTHRCGNCGKISHEGQTTRSRKQASATLAPSK